MSEQPHEPVFNKGPSGKTVGVLFIVGAGLMLLGFAIDATSRSKDESIGAILPTVLGFFVLLLDVILFLVWAVRRKRQAPPDA